MTDCTEYHAGMVIMRKTALVIRLQTSLMNMCTTSWYAAHMQLLRTFSTGQEINLSEWR